MHRSASSRTRLLILLAYVGFISLGLPDAVIGVAWPSVRDTFRLPQGAAGLVFVASGVGYFVTSFIYGRLTRVLGIGLLLAASTGLVSSAMFGFAFSRLWPLFVACAMVHGLGSGGHVALLLVREVPADVGEFRDVTEEMLLLALERRRFGSL